MSDRQAKGGIQIPKIVGKDIGPLSEEELRKANENKKEVERLMSEIIDFLRRNRGKAFTKEEIRDLSGIKTKPFHPIRNVNNSNFPIEYAIKNFEASIHLGNDLPIIIERNEGKEYFYFKE